MGKKTKNQTTSVEPWKPGQAYLIGNAAKGIPGILPGAAQWYQQYGNMPGIASGALENMQGILQRQGADTYLSDVALPGLKAVMSGGLAPALETPQDIGPLSGMMNTVDLSNRIRSISPIQGAQIGNIANIDMNQARAGLGALNPTGTLQRMLSGQVDRKVLDPQAKAIVDMMTRNTQESVLPGIRSGALGAGQYGSSRQGIAEGLAVSRLQQDIAPALTNLYGTAFENAQQRAATLGNALNQQAFQAAAQNQQMQYNREAANAANEMARQQFNANLGLQSWDRDYNLQSQNMANELARQQFNANLGLQRNQQLQQDRQMRMDEIMQGANLYDAAQQMQLAPFQQLLNYSQYPQQYALQNLQNYAGLVQPIAGMGQSEVTPMQKSGLGGALGGALGGRTLAGMLGASKKGAGLAGPWGLAAGAGLGLLGGLLG